MNKVLIKRLPSRIVIYVIAILMKIWICFVVLSCRKIVIGKEYAEAMQKAEDSHIKAIWHRNILLGPLATLKKKSYATLVTPHEDGEVGVAYAILSRFKIVRGSGTGSSNKRKPKGPIKFQVQLNDEQKIAKQKIISKFYKKPQQKRKFLVL